MVQGRKKFEDFKEGTKKQVKKVIGKVGNVNLENNKVETAH